jgi:hypothetical protein
LANSVQLFVFAHVDRHERVGLACLHFDRVVVDLARTGDGGHARRGLRDEARVVVRRVLLHHLLEVEHDRVGVDVAAVVELRAAADLEDPLRLVLRVDRVALRETRDHRRGLVGRREVPLREAVEHRDAGEAVAFEARVGLAGGGRNIGRGHADAQHRLRGSGSGREQAGGEQSEQLDSRHGSPLVLDD